MKKILITIAALSGFFISENAYSTCSNYTSYNDGQTLTASSLNSLQTNYTNCVNNVLNGDNFTGNINLYNGSDLNFYSDAGTTLKASIDGATGDFILNGGDLTLSDSASKISYSNYNSHISVGETGATLSVQMDFSVNGSTQLLLDETGQALFSSNIYGYNGLTLQGSTDFIIKTNPGVVKFQVDGSTGNIETIGTLPSAGTPSANTPYRQSLAKGWGTIGSGATSTNAYNVTSVTNPSTGDYVITWNTDAATSSGYVVIGTALTTASNIVTCTSGAAGTTNCSVYNAATAAKANGQFYVVAFGDQ